MKKFKYTIYTENTPQLRPLLDKHLPGYTIMLGEGRWKGQTEQSAMIVYIAFSPTSISIDTLCQYILANCKQDSVYLETQEINIEEFTK